MDDRSWEDRNRDSPELGTERGRNGPLFGRGYTTAEDVLRVRAGNRLVARPGANQRPPGVVQDVDDRTEWARNAGRGMGTVSFSVGKR